MQKEEKWRSVVGYEGYYEVSSEGRVRNVKTGRILKPRLRPNGYKIVTPSKENKVKTFSIHRLVAVAFIPNQENKPCVNHIDNNPSNNHVSNLEWVTHHENNQHAVMQGRMIGPRGEEQGNSKLTSEQVIEIFKSKLLHRELGVVYGVSRAHISSIKSGKRWSHLLLHSK
jgi:hypothetical protein